MKKKGVYLKMIRYLTIGKMKKKFKKRLDMNTKKVLYLGMIKGDNMISKKLVSDITNKIEQHHKLYRFPVKQSYGKIFLTNQSMVGIQIGMVVVTLLEQMLFQRVRTRQGIRIKVVM